jgi:hypothetical protein
MTDEPRPEPPPLGDAPPSVGPWIVVQLLDVPSDEHRRERYPEVLAEALTTHDLVVTDVHPAVSQPNTLMARCPDLPADPELVLRHVAELVARLLRLPTAQAVRVADYPDLESAHRAAGDRDADGG